MEAQSIRRKLDPESPGLQGLAGPLMLLLLHTPLGLSSLPASPGAGPATPQ